jgi:hypothetical protein
MKMNTLKSNYLYENKNNETPINCKLHCGVRAVSFAGFSFRSSVSFGQERSSKSAPTTCTNP